MHLYKRNVRLTYIYMYMYQVCSINKSKFFFFSYKTNKLFYSTIFIPCYLFQTSSLSSPKHLRQHILYNSRSSFWYALELLQRFSFYLFNRHKVPPFHRSFQSCKQQKFVAEASSEERVGSLSWSTSNKSFVYKVSDIFSYYFTQIMHNIYIILLINRIPFTPI